MKKTLLVGALCYLAVFALIGAVIFSNDDAKRPFFAVMDEPFPGYWTLFWGSLPDGAAMAAEIGAISLPVFILVWWWRMRRRNTSFAPMLAAASSAGLINAAIISNYLNNVGRAVKPLPGYSLPWYDNPVFAETPAILVLIFVATTLCTYLGTLLVRR